MAASALAPETPAASTTADAPLRVLREGAIVTLQFDRPNALNAIDIPMAEALLHAVQDLAVDTSVRCVVLRGNGRAFMSGGDLPTLRQNLQRNTSTLMAPLHAAVAQLARIDAPVIAQVHGVAAGAGLSLMLQADLVLAAEGTQFNLAYMNLGTSCDVGASWALPRWVGLRRALEIAMLSETVDAVSAERMGLINRIVPAADLERTVHALAERLAHGPTFALGQMRRLMRESFDRTLPAQLDAEAAAFAACARSADLPEGLDAFFAKRRPVFQGR